ncbi:MAG: type II toxin-antitoxin system Phd/YefM family antitoxin [Betaproteobacteria bacterium]|nr:type II toxin-antitoxin system Phd/YefM family antitoxin [Betaproteobacteria bacterium]
MLSFTANDAKTRFGELLDRVQREPVQITRHNRVVGIVVSPEDYEAMRQFYADRLRGMLASTAQAAAQAGLTEQELGRFLADES